MIFYICIVKPAHSYSRLLRLELISIIKIKSLVKQLNNKTKFNHSFFFLSKSVILGYTAALGYTIQTKTWFQW